MDKTVAGNFREQETFITTLCSDSDHDDTSLARYLSEAAEQG